MGNIKAMKHLSPIEKSWRRCYASYHGEYPKEIKRYFGESIAMFKAGWRAALRKNRKRTLTQ